MEYNSKFVSFAEKLLKHNNRPFDAVVYGLN